MKSLFAYIRVSTQKQGTQGSSLQEQRAAIEVYIKRNNLSVAAWFEESETAAKRGRPMFTRMMRALLRGDAQGVVIHKIDRSARNLRDWADLGDLIDRGVDVHFAHESLDMHSRGGRLAADIQAVVAADFIRNLRDEVKKGFYGRLKQGLYPLQAPIGYQDMGGGKAKTIHPIHGPLVRQAFELYATGDHNFQTLQAEMTRRGLRTRTGKRVSFDGLTRILNNPFYYGVISIKKSNQSFQGIHPPLIRKALFDHVQQVLRGNRLAGAAWTHEFLFRRLIRCAHCGRVLIGERQKQRYVYYRCHDPKCGLVSLSETIIDRHISALFDLLRLDEDLLGDLRDMVEVLRGTAGNERAQQEAALRLQLTQCGERLARLTDALIDGILEKTLFEEKKLMLLNERRALQDRIDQISLAPSQADRIAGYLELTSTAYIQYKNGLAGEKREMVLEVTSNFTGSRNTPAIALKSPFQEMVEYRISQCGAPHQDDRRTQAKQMLDILMGVADTESAGAANDNKRRHSSVDAAGGSPLQSPSSPEVPVSDSSASPGGI